MNFQRALTGCIGTTTGHDGWEYASLSIAINGVLLISKGFDQLLQDSSRLPRRENGIGRHFPGLTCSDETDDHLGRRAHM